MSYPALVSIVMPAYKPRYFAQALDSVLAQTYTALEPGDLRRQRRWRDRGHAGVEAG